MIPRQRFTPRILSDLTTERKATSYRLVWRSSVTEIPLDLH